MAANREVRQFFWAILSAGECCKLWLLDKGRWGIWFYLSLIPFSVCIGLILRHAGPLERPSLWVLLRDDPRLVSWPRLAKLVGHRFP